MSRSKLEHHLGGVWTGKLQLAADVTVHLIRSLACLLCLLLAASLLYPPAQRSRFSHLTRVLMAVQPFEDSPEIAAVFSACRAALVTLDGNVDAGRYEGLWKPRNTSLNPMLLECPLWYDIERFHIVCGVDLNVSQSVPTYVMFQIHNVEIYVYTTHSNNLIAT